MRPGAATVVLEELGKDQRRHVHRVKRLVAHILTRRGLLMLLLESWAA